MTRIGAIRRVLWITLGLNLLATLAKMGVGYLTGSLSIVADGFDSLFDSASNVIGLVGMSFAARPPDEDHPYGHRKFETLAAISVSVLLLVTCVELVRSVIDRLSSPAVPRITLWSFAALIFSIGVHLFTVVYERSRGRELQSEFLLADASHTAADIYVSLSVIAGLILVRLGYPIVDALLALGIAGVIAKIGVDIIRSSSAILMDRAMVSGREIERLVVGVEGVESCHRIRSRGTEDDIHIDLHIHVAPETPIDRAHAIAHEVQKKVTREIPGVQDVVVHVEPGALGKGVDVVGRIRAVAEGLNCQVHEIRAHEIEGQLWVDLHMEVEESLSLGEAHRLATLLEERIQESLENMARVYVHIEPLEAVTQEVETAEGDYRIESEVKRLVEGTEDIKECHKVRVRRFQGRLFISLHCVLDGKPSVAEAHDISTRLERTIGEGLKGVDQVLVHLEPPDLKAKGG